MKWSASEKWPGWQVEELGEAGGWRGTVSPPAVGDTAGL